jgi:hypothetical protein
VLQGPVSTACLQNSVTGFLEAAPNRFCQSLFHFGKWRKSRLHLHKASTLYWQAGFLSMMRHNKVLPAKVFWRSAKMRPCTSLMP